MTFRDTLAPKPSPLDVASMPNTMFPEEIREYSDQIRNAYYYSRNLGVPPQIAMDLEPAINEHLYGEGISSSQAWQQTSSRTLSSRRKSLHTAAYDGWRNSVASATAQAAGFGRFLAEFKGIDQSVVDPAFRWMLGIPKDVDLDDVLAGISVAARQDIIDGNKDNPNRTLAIDQDAGYAEALYQVITRPENLLQGLVESGPLILEGMLTGGAFGKILGAGAVRAGRILGMGVPISSQAYGDARAEGTAPLSALGQALLTGGIEAVIEEWTLGRKIGLAKHFKRYVQSGGMRRAVWEGTKAFGRGTAEEGTQTLNENFWRWVFTDRSQEWFEGVSQAMAMGGPLEAVMSGAFSGVSVIGTPVEAKEAQRRLKVLRKLVKNSTLSPAEKEALNLEFDKAAGLVPDILTPIEKGLQEKGARFVKTPSGEMGEGEIRDAKRKAEEAKTKPEIGEGEGGEGYTPSVTEGMGEPAGPTTPTPLNTGVQGQEVYHGTRSEIDISGISTDAMQEGKYGKAIGFTPDLRDAETHSRRGFEGDGEPRILKATISEDAKVLEFDNAQDFEVEVNQHLEFNKEWRREHPDLFNVSKERDPRLPADVLSTHELQEKLYSTSREGVIKNMVEKYDALHIKGVSYSSRSIDMGDRVTSQGERVGQGSYTEVTEHKIPHGEEWAIYNPDILIATTPASEKAPEMPSKAEKPAEAETVPKTGVPSEEGAYETPEEAKTARTQLEAEAGEKVSPRLYIGNVTPRAKKAWGKIFGKPPAAVHTFKEGAFPTKRTAIEMTRGQAESYLTWLEEDLASRIDNNEINTNRDIAMAHVDWGDIASIRRVLGIEVGVEPFRVHYTKAKKMAYIDQKEVAKLRNEIHRLDKQLSTLNAKEETTELTDAEDTTRDRLAAELRALEEKVYQLQRAAGAAVSILKNVKAVISSAVTPSKLQMSNLTVQEVLRATMKRGARYAKMAYAGGRRELRAQIQAQREARRRLASAIKRARQPIPNTVKLEYRQAIHELRKGVDLRRRSQKVLAERRTMRRLVEKYPEVFKGMPTKRMAQLLIRPLNDFTIGELEDLASQIDTLIAMGQVAKEQVVVQEEKMKKRDLGALTAGSTKATARDIIRPDQVGKPLTLEQRTKNTLAKLINTAKVKWRAFTMPMDVLFDLADGGTATYDGPNYRIFKRTLDERYGHYKNRADGLVHDVRELARALGLTNPNFERIGVYAVDQQKGGRQKLLDTGYTETEIKSVELNDGEMQVYAAMREALDELRPDVEAVLRDVYDREMSVVENYFPWLTNFAEMSDSKIQDMFGDTVKEYEGPVKQKKVDLGITLTRTYGTQAVKINAMEVFERHVDNASYLIEMSGDIKRLFEIANTQQYSDAVGESVQMEVLNYLSLMARKGGIERNKSIPILDVYRKHVGAATLGFKLSSALINVTPLLDGAGLIGRYAFTGAYDIATNQELRVFLGKNFPELRDRMGGEIDLRDFGSSTLQRIEKAGFWPLQKIDGLTAMSIVAGAYQKYLDEHGLKLDLTRPNTEGIAEAQRIMRRTQASGFSKDLPSAFTQGTVTGNVSIDRLLLHFQTFIVNRWSFIEHDMLRAGIKTGNTTQMMNIFFWMSMALFAELGLRRMSKELIAMMTGEDLDDWGETFTNEWVANALQTVPGLSQATSAYTYGSMPVPTLAITNDLLVKLQYLKRTKNPNKKLIKAIELGLLSTGTAMGVPGTRQLSDIANSYNRTLPSSRGKKKFEWKSTR